MVTNANVDWYSCVRRIVRDICQRWPSISAQEESELVAILCTSEGELMPEEVFARFEARPSIKLQNDARKIISRVRVEREHLDQMSQVNRWIRREIKYKEAFPD